jgi:hypothetical protein
MRKTALSWTAALLALSLAVGCEEPGGGPAGPGDGGGGPELDAGPGEGCDDVTPAAMIFATSCATSGACHVTGGQYPDLTRDALAMLAGAPSMGMPGETLIVPGEPEQSWLYRKVSGMQGATGGLLMPIGSAEPIDGMPVLEAWIRAGAPTRCDTEPPMPPIPRDPNTLDQGELFTCAAPTAASSPARIRRVERAQWTHSAGRTLRDAAYSNPFYAPEGDYSTYSDDVSIDPATLDLYLLVLPQVASLWAGRDSFPRLWAVYDEPSVRCMFNDAAPDDACIDNYVDRLLPAGVLFRAPSDGERSRLRALLVEGIAAEGGDDTQRRATLTHVTSAAWLTSGALFHPELGEPVPGDPAGRRRLTDDELALALGAVLSTHAPGSSLPTSVAGRPGEPDRSMPENGWLGQVRIAADDGSIQDADVLRTLLQTYRGGVDLARADIALDSDSRDLPARGEHWLAPRIAGFFREWLDYGSANSAFKDTPVATSAWEDEGTAANSWSNLQHSYYGYESTFVAQLDDTIARAVIESEASGADVLRTLLTTRMWRLPSNLAMANDTACTSSAECPDGLRCQPAIGLCANSSSNSTVSAHRVYGLTENVPATSEGRWVMVPEGQRAGVLTHPAWLIAHGGNFEDDASAVLRGRWIREHLYCQTVPGLDLVMVEAQLVPSDPALRARDRVRVSIEEGAESATCMGCHRLMNSLGMPFEIYNHAGFLRDSDHGMTPDGRSVIDNAPDPSLNGEVADALELSEMLSESPYARRCFIRHVFRYFMGRDETAADACTLTAMESAFAGGSFFAMLEALVTSDTFLYRHVEGGAP